MIQYNISKNKAMFSLEYIGTNYHSVPVQMKNGMLCLISMHFKSTVPSLKQQRHNECKMPHFCEINVQNCEIMD